MPNLKKNGIVKWCKQIVKICKLSDEDARVKQLYEHRNTAVVPIRGGDTLSLSELTRFTEFPMLFEMHLDAYVHHQTCLSLQKCMRLATKWGLTEYKKKNYKLAVNRFCTAFQFASFALEGECIDIAKAEYNLGATYDELRKEGSEIDNKSRCKQHAIMFLEASRAHRRMLKQTESKQSSLHDVAIQKIGRRLASLKT